MAKLVGLSGSLRAASFNTGLLRAAAELVPEGSSLTVATPEGIPLYNADLEREAGMPEAVERLKAQIIAADALLLATPEYNNGIPGVLKNAIDWLSRPYGTGALTGKPVAVLSAALGQYGGAWTREDTRKSVGIAGGRAIAEADLGLQLAALPEAGLDSPEVVEKVVASVTRLVDEVAVSA